MRRAFRNDGRLQWVATFSQPWKHVDRHRPMANCRHLSMAYAGRLSHGDLDDNLSVEDVERDIEDFRRDLDVLSALDVDVPVLRIQERLVPVFVNGYGRVERIDSESIWTAQHLARIHNGTALMSTSTGVCAVMTLYLSALAAGVHRASALGETQDGSTAQLQTEIAEA